MLNVVIFGMCAISFLMTVYAYNLGCENALDDIMEALDLVLRDYLDEDGDPLFEKLSDDIFDKLDRL